VIDSVLATVAEMLVARGQNEAADIVKRTTPRLEESGWDNWDGGITLWTIRLPIEPALYARLGKQREEFERQIDACLAPVISQQTNDRYSATISPHLLVRPDWRQGEPSISETTRRNIFDGLRLENVIWHGRLNPVEFLQRIWNLKRLPSGDPRYNDAAGDIWQHTVNNEDLDLDWIYEDERFNLLGCRSEIFLRFLCEIVHPIVRPDRTEANTIVEHFNEQLRQEFWELSPVEKIAGRPRYSFRSLRNRAQRSVSRARSVADALDAGWMQQEIERLENAIEADPALAIGTAKDLVESCCKTILARRKVEFSRGADLGDLAKLLTRELQLVPEDVSDAAKGADSIRLILRNLTSISHNLAALRGLYGSGHGRDGKHRGLTPRHARLAVAAAVAFIDFVSETYRQRETKKQASQASEAKKPLNGHSPR